jgi:hypothetical protein
MKYFVGGIESAYHMQVWEPVAYAKQDLQDEIISITWQILLWLFIFGLVT